MRITFITAKYTTANNGGTCALHLFITSIIEEHPYPIQVMLNFCSHVNGNLGASSLLGPCGILFLYEWMNEWIGLDGVDGWCLMYLMTRIKRFHCTATHFYHLPKVYN